MKWDKKEFFGPQKEFMRSKAERLLFSGAVGAGKTYVLCCKGFYLNVMYPGNKGALIRKTGSSLRSSTLQTLLKGNNKVNPVIPEDWIIKHNKNEKKIVHKTKKPGKYSTIIYTGVEKGAKDEYPKKLGSTEFGWIGVDEAIELDKGDWDWLETRLRHPVPINQIFGATNPASPEHWLYDKFMKGDTEETEVYHATPYENPFLKDGYVERLERQYSSGMMRKRMLKGEWVAAEGLVYPDFSRQKHVTAEAGNRDYKQYIVGADSGWKNPRAALIGGVTGSGDIHIIDEYKKSRTHIGDLGNWLKRKPMNFYKLYHDPSEPGEIEKLNKEYNIHAVKGNNEIVPGIGSVTSYFQEEPPNIKIHPDCTKLINEIISYRYPKNKEDSEKPVEENDHLMDSLRYMVHSHPATTSADADSDLLF